MNSDPRQLHEIGRQLRIDAIRAASAAGSGHPTSAMSAADLIAVLAANHLRYDFDAPADPANDHLILSKGHASPLLYALYHRCGAISEAELLSFRRFDSRLEGHPTPRLPWVDVATGSLGQGLPIGVGVALSDRLTDAAPYRVWVLCGDSELAEGSIWEAFEHAGDLGLSNLTVLVDVNRLGQRGPTRHAWDLDAYRRRIEAFGWYAIVIDGHDVEAIDHAYAEARSVSGQPSAVIARTVKGSGVDAVADQEGAHGKPISDTDSAIAELGGVRPTRIEVARPQAPAQTRRPMPGVPTLRKYDVGDTVATRNAFGEAMVSLGDARDDVVLLDGEVADSTRAQKFADAHPDRFLECYIAEQEMLATAVGLQTRGWVPYVATFAAFLSRAYDFVRMAAISRANVKLVGSHAGVAIGQDGPSQMGLEDIAAFRAVHDSVVLHPCDANSAAQLTTALAEHRGIGYLRTLRGDTPVIYGADERFEIGGSKVPHSSADDALTVVAAGITVHEAIEATHQLAAEGIAARIVDAYSIKPIDTATLRAAARETAGLLVVEDHWPEGGLGDAVLDAFATGEPGPRMVKLGVSRMPASATPDEQLSSAGIDAESIAAAARAFVATLPAR